LRAEKDLGQSNTDKYDILKKEYLMKAKSNSEIQGENEELIEKVAQAEIQAEHKDE